VTAALAANGPARVDLFVSQINQYWVMPGRSWVTWQPNPQEAGINDPNADPGRGCVSDDNPARQELTALLREAFINGKRCALEHHQVNPNWPDEIIWARCVR
jgi:hypothetical protein